MANPNIVGVQYIRGRTANRKYVKRESRYLLRNLANSNEVLKVNTITATNNSNTTQKLTVQLVSASGTSNVITDVPIPKKTTFNVLQKNFSIYLEENASINVSTSTFNDKIGVYCSYEQIATSLVNDRNDNYDTDTTINVVKSGLVLSLDAADSGSYTANSNTWFDISDANNNGTLINGPTFSSANGGSLVFDATNDHISIGSQNIVGTGNAPFTVEMWFNNNRTYASGAYTMLCRVKQDSEFFTVIYNPSGTYNVYSTFRGFTQFGTPVTNSDFINKWICLHAVYTGGNKNSASSYKTYINGTLIATGTNNFGTAGGTGSNCNIIGADGSSGCNVTGGYHGGNFSVYRLYNRELTSTEVTQNFNAIRNRYFPLNIVYSGLTVYLDAANPSSYPGSGSTWTDLSGNGNNMTLYNSPTFSSSNEGVLQFNGTNQYGTIPLNYSTTTFTIMAASRYSGSVRGRVITASNNNWLFGHWGNGTQKYFAEGWLTSSSYNENSDTNWRVFAGLENYSLDQRSFYVNNVALVTNSTAGSQGFNGLSVGGQIYNEWSTCEVSIILVYNRILSEAEMTQNFNAIRSRYGL